MRAPHAPAHRRTFRLIFAITTVVSGWFPCLPRVKHSSDDYACISPSWLTALLLL